MLIFSLIGNRLVYFLHVDFGCNFLYDVDIKATVVVSWPNELLIFRVTPVHLPI